MEVDDSVNIDNEEPELEKSCVKEQLESMVEINVEMEISPSLEVPMAAVETKEPKGDVEVTVKHMKEFPFFDGKIEYSVELMLLKECTTWNARLPELTDKILEYSLKDIIKLESMSHFMYITDERDVNLVMEQMERSVSPL